MATENSFGWLVLGKAVSETKLAFGSTKWDVFIGAFCVVVGFGIYWVLRGLPVAMEQLGSVAAFTFTPLGFVLVAVFFWNLWLAPAALAYEAGRASKRQGYTGKGGSVYGLYDDETRNLAGKLGRLGEVIAKPGFKGFTSDTSDDYYIRDILQSTHPIWTKSHPRQLRRDFENQTGRISDANKANDLNSRAVALGELASTVDTLSAILLGEA